MPEGAFTRFTEQALALSYEQTLILMAKMLENLRNKRAETETTDDYKQLENTVSRSSMNTMWEELKNDTW